MDEDWPVRAAHRPFISSEMPWTNSSRQASGITPRSGHRIGCQDVALERSLIDIE